jgi:2'-5' RNA ligase
MKTEEQLIWESYSVVQEQQTPTEFGCLMVYLEGDQKQKVLDFIAENFSQEQLDPTEGAEDEPHVTVAYGFYPDVDVQEIRRYIKENFPKTVTFQLKNITKFDNPEYDVIKVDVESQDLNDIHYALREYFGDRLNVTFPDYHPHMTLAYCKKGACEDLMDNNFFSGGEIQSNKFIFSEPGMEKKYSFTNQ